MNDSLDVNMFIQDTVKVHLPVRHVFFQQINHSCHLTVNKNSVSALLQFGQQSIQDVEFACIGYQTLTVRNNDA